MTAQLGLIRTLRGLDAHIWLDRRQPLFDDIRIERPFSTNPNLARVGLEPDPHELRPARFFAGTGPTR